MCNLYGFFMVAVSFSHPLSLSIVDLLACSLTLEQYKQWLVYLPRTNKLKYLTGLSLFPCPLPWLYSTSTQNKKSNTIKPYWLTYFLCPWKFFLKTDQAYLSILFEAVLKKWKNQEFFKNISNKHNNAHEAYWLTGKSNWKNSK